MLFLSVKKFCMINILMKGGNEGIGIPDPEHSGEDMPRKFIVGIPSI
jgi:hypothetical protein